MDTTIYNLEQINLQIKKKWNFIFVFITILFFLIFIVNYFINWKSFLQAHQSNGLSGFNQNYNINESLLTIMAITFFVMFIVSFFAMSIQRSGNFVQSKKTINDFYTFYGITPIGKMTGLFTIDSYIILEIKWEPKGYFKLSYDKEILAYVKPKELFWKIRYITYSLSLTHKMQKY